MVVLDERSQRRRMRLTGCALLAMMLLIGAPAWAVDYPIVVHRGNGLANVFAKLNAGGSAKIAYIGGSITENPGWRDHVTNWIKSRYPGRITEINAGWSGTGSLIGATRFARDVLVHNPDLIFVEFAVNDLPEDPLLFVQRNSEGFPRQAWLQNARIDLCFVETIAWYSEGAYLSGVYPTPVQAHYDVCDSYGLPSVNMGWALYEQVLAGTPWTSLAPDRVHPNAAGSQIYSNAVISYLDAERTRSPVAADHVLPPALTDHPVMSGTITELAAISPLPAGWVARFNQNGLVSYIESTAPNAQITVSFPGPAAALKLLMTAETYGLSASVDGGPFASLGLPFNGWQFVWALPVAKMYGQGTHTLTIRVPSGTARLINVESASTATAPPAGTNLALTASGAVADTQYSADFGPDKARDGQASTKWTSTGTSANHWLAYDLGSRSAVSRFVVKHASSGGEPTYYNTQAFTIESAPDMQGPWSVQFIGPNGAQAGASIFDYTSPVAMRYVRLNISDAGIDNYARIPEFEVWGSIIRTPGDFDADGDVDQSDYGRFQACMSGPGIEQNDASCADARLDNDDDVDQDDFLAFQGCMSGANVPAEPDCGP